MQHLDKIDEVGKGIAVAFVATIYGVGFANLIFLPIAGKLRHLRIREEQIIREMTLEGVISILEGINPRMLEAKLLGFLGEAQGPAAGSGDSSSGESHARGASAESAAYDAPPPSSFRKRQSRSLACFLCRLRHALVRLFCRALRLLASRQKKSRKTGVGHSGSFSGNGSLQA